jgi:O-acetyl-ADP-ribose deacetylase (regulator of RNase III)
VSTGIYGYPIEDATHIAMDEVRTYLESEKGKKASRLSMYSGCTLISGCFFRSSG